MLGAGGECERIPGFQDGCDGHGCPWRGSRRDATQTQKIQRPVLFGENGRSEVMYETDAFHDELGIAVEVEAVAERSGMRIIATLSAMRSDKLAQLSRRTLPCCDPPLARHHTIVIQRLTCSKPRLWLDCQRALHRGTNPSIAPQPASTAAASTGAGTGRSEMSPLATDEAPANIVARLAGT